MVLVIPNPNSGFIHETLGGAMGMILRLRRRLCSVLADKSNAADRGMAVDQGSNPPLSFDHLFPLRRKEKHLVEPWGFEPQTSSMPLRRSTN